MRVAKRPAREIRRRRIGWLSAGLAALSLAAVLVAQPAYAGKGGELRIEEGWYAGHEVTFLQPSLFSATPNGGVFFCFGLGPDLAGVDRLTAPLYVIVDPSATQDRCDGDPTLLRHDHVLSVAPGDAGYTGAWTIVLLVAAQPRSIDLVTHPFTDAAHVRAAIDAGVLVQVPTGSVTFVAPVIGGS